MEVELFEGIEPDPSVTTVMKGAEAMLKFEPDWIVAIGGGSPIDAAKAMWIKYEYPEITFEEMCKVFGIPPLRRKAHLRHLLHLRHCDRGNRLLHHHRLPEGHQIPPIADFRDHPGRGHRGPRPGRDHAQEAGWPTPVWTP